MPADLRPHAARILAMRTCYVDEVAGVEAPDPVLVDAHQTALALLNIAEAAQALVDDTLANAGNCPRCGEEDGAHTTDCRFAPLVAALKRLETK